MSNRPRDFHKSWGGKKSPEQVLSKRAPGSCRTLSNPVFPERVANFIGPCACWVILNSGARGGREVKRSFGSIPCLQAWLPERATVCVPVYKDASGDCGRGNRPQAPVGNDEVVIPASWFESVSPASALEFEQLSCNLWGHLCGSAQGIGRTSLLWQQQLHNINDNNKSENVSSR